MDTLLFLAAIVGIAFVILRFIVEDSRAKKAEVLQANAVRTSLLQNQSDGPPKAAPWWQEPRPPTL